jgi:hypothetical protein
MRVTCVNGAACQLCEFLEGALDAVGDSGGGVVEVVADFKHSGGGRGESPECVECGGPVDGAVAGPEMLVANAVVVVDVELGDALAEDADGFDDAGRDVGVAEVKANVDLVKVGHIQDVHEVLGGGGIAGEILDEDAHAEGLGEDAEVLERGGCVFERAHGEAVEIFAEVDDEFFDGDVFGGFEGALDLVHGIDAARFFRMDEVDGRCPGAAHFAVGPERRVHRPGLERIGGEPGSEFGDVLAAGVVEVLPCCEKFYALSAGAGGGFEDSGVQPLFQKEVGGQDGQHAWMVLLAPLSHPEKRVWSLHAQGRSMTAR